MVDIPKVPEKPGFWKSLGLAAVELLGNIIYQGPR
jgi:hypothetical protein